MKKNSTIVKLISTFVTMAVIGCSSISKPMSDSEKFDQIQLYDTAERVEKIYGIGESSVEKYSNIEFKTLNYYKSASAPDVYFTIEKNGEKVVAKSRWIYPDELLHDLKYTLSEKFKGLAFEEYIPCHTWSNDDKVLINENTGIFVVVSKSKVDLISWTTQDLARARAKEFMIKCPRLQKFKK
jgi:hypothetical protein